MFEKIIGSIWEKYQEELYNVIEEGNFLKWIMYIQVMLEEEVG